MKVSGPFIHSLKITNDNGSKVARVIIYNKAYFSRDGHYFNYYEGKDYSYLVKSKDRDRIGKIRPYFRIRGHTETGKA
jgi:hypothetical protein